MNLAKTMQSSQPQTEKPIEKVAVNEQTSPYGLSRATPGARLSLE